jgi:hypothetical protein
LSESRDVSVNETLECERKVVVDVRCGVHGTKRGGVRGVREEDRHHRQVLVTVELRLALFHRVANPIPNSAVTRTRK